MADDKDKRPSDDVDEEWEDEETQSEAEADGDDKSASDEDGWDEEDWEDAEDEDEDEEDDEDEDEEGADDEGDDEPVDDAPEEEEEADEEDDEDEEDDDYEEDDGDDDEEDWLPDWAPWAVLLGLVALGLLGGFGFFTSKPDAEATAADVPATAESAEPEAEKRPEPEPAKKAEQESIRASHLLVAYKGAQRARPDITRSKEEAKKRAEEALKKTKAPGADFAKIVAEYSDEPGAAERGGDLRRFTKNRMVKPFADAAFELKVGEISGVVETGFGFHVIKRTE